MDLTRLYAYTHPTYISVRIHVVHHLMLIVSVILAIRPFATGCTTTDYGLHDPSDSHRAHAILRSVFPPAKHWRECRGRGKRFHSSEGLGRPTDERRLAFATELADERSMDGVSTSAEGRITHRAQQTIPLLSSVLV